AGPVQRTGVLIRSRSCGDLNRSVSTPEFGIDRGKNDANFSDEIRVEKGIRTDARAKSNVLHHKTVANRSDVGSADAGKGGRFPSEYRSDIFGSAHATHEFRQSQYVVSNVRQCQNPIGR